LAIWQGTGSGAGTNTSGFSALLAGYRDPRRGRFQQYALQTYFWSSTENSSNSTFNLLLAHIDNHIYLRNDGKDLGFSIRCLNDEPVAVEEVYNHLPEQYELSQNYPNPFNPTTEISFAIPNAGYVKLLVYNSVGEVVSELVNGYKETGGYTVTFDANYLTSGVYFYRLEAGNYSEVKKMSLLK